MIDRGRLSIGCVAPDRRGPWWAGLFAAALLGPLAVRGAEAADARRDLLAGNYAGVIDQASAALAGPTGDSEWSLVQVEALLAVGRNPEADVAMAEALRRDLSRRLRQRAENYLSWDVVADKTLAVYDRALRRKMN